MAYIHQDQCTAQNGHTQHIHVYIHVYIQQCAVYTLLVHKQTLLEPCNVTLKSKLLLMPTSRQHVLFVLLHIKP